MTDATTGNPLPGGIIVTVQGNALTAETLTDANGNYSILGLAPGSYTIRASATNYQTAVQGAIVDSNQSTTVDFALQPFPGSITGQIINLSTSSPVAGALVTVLLGNTQIESTQTDSNGNYTLSGLASGNYSVQASADSLQALTLGALVLSNQTTTLNFALQSQPGTLSGQVIDDLTNLPLVGVEVDIFQGSVRVAFALTNSQGIFQIDNLAISNYTATASFSNYQTQSIGASIQANQTTIINFSLVSQPGSINGQVLDAATNAPLAGALINASQGTALSALILTDASGNYTLSGLAPGNYTLSASLANYQTQTQATSVLSNQSSTVNFSLVSQPGTVSGEVLDTSNTPISGAEIDILLGTTIIASAFTDDNGNYTLSGLAPGNYTLRISANNFQTSLLSITVQANQTTVSNITLSLQIGSLSGIVINASNSLPISGATVYVLQANILIASSITDLSGGYIINNLAPGTYTIRASAASYETSLLGATIYSSETTTTDFALQSQPGSIYGIVTDSSTSSVIEGVKIEILQSNIVITSISTASDGSYTLSGLSSGNYIVRASIASYQIQLTNATVQANQTTTVNFALLNFPGALNGTVLDSSNLPITGAILQLLSNNLSVASTTTAIDGSFSFNSLAPGNYTLQVFAGDYQTVIQAANVQANLVTTVSFILQSQPGNIIGQVVDSFGNPIAGATLSASLSNVIVSSALTDANGAFIIANLAPGNYTLTASAVNFQNSTQGGVVQANLSTSLTFVLGSQPGQIIGLVKDALTNAPIPNANLDLLLNNQIIASTLTNANGNYIFSNLAPGTYAVRASSGNYQISIQGAIVAPNQTITDNFALESFPGTITGQVIDARTQNPIPSGSIISLINNAFITEVLTDGNGNYVMTNLAPGSYTLRASASNYQTFAQGAIVISNETTIENFVLEPEPGSIQGQATHSLNGDVIPGASIIILQGNARITSSTTDSNGNFTISNLAPDTYTVNISATGYQTQSIVAIVLANQTVILNFSLNDLPGGIIGQVTDSSTSEPVPGANVSIYQGASRLGFTLTDSNGNYICNGLAEGNYILSTTAPNFQTQALGATVEANQFTTLDFSLQDQTGNLSGKVIDSITLLPIAGAEIDVMQGPVILTFILTDSNGDYLITGLAPDSYTVRASANNYQTQTIGASIQTNQTTNLGFALNSQPGSLTGLVIDVLTNLPISSAQINVLQGTSLIATTLSDPSGIYLITGLAPGNYTVQANASGYQIQSLGASIHANQITTVNFALLNLTGRLDGQVLSAATHLPLAGVRIEVLQGPLLIATTLSDSSGHFIITGLEPGDYQIRESLQHYQTYTQNIEIIANQATTVDSMLFGDAGSISGQVFNIIGQPIAGASIYAYQGLILVASALSDQNGFYTLTGLASGTYQVVANASKHQSSTQEANVLSDQTTQINFFLGGQFAHLFGRVTDQLTSKGIAGARIELFLGHTLIAFARTDHLGNYSIDNLPPGIYKIKIEATSYKTVKQKLEISQSVENLDFSLIYTLPAPADIWSKVIHRCHGKKIEIQHVIHWLPSPEPQVIEYRILCDHQLIETIPANASLEYRTHLKCSTKTYVYEVIAVDRNGNESAPAKIKLRFMH